MTLDLMFLMELQRQCRFAVIAAAEAHSAMHNPDGSRKRTDMNRFWFAIQGLLGAVGNISKILSPSAKQSEERGRRLRVLVSLDDSSCLGPRTFRNHLEHFDERLETWFEDVGCQGFA